MTGKEKTMKTPPFGKKLHVEPFDRDKEKSGVAMTREAATKVFILQLYPHVQHQVKDPSPLPTDLMVITVLNSIMGKAQSFDYTTSKLEDNDAVTPIFNACLTAASMKLMAEGANEVLLTAVTTSVTSIRNSVKYVILQMANITTGKEN